MKNKILVLSLLLISSGVFADSKVREFINSLTPAELESVAKPDSNSIRLKMNPPFPLATEATNVKCTHEEFSKMAAAVKPEIAIYASKIMGVLSFQEDLRMIDYLKKVETLAIQKKKSQAAKAAKKIYAALEKDRPAIEAAISKNLEGPDGIWKDQKVMHEAGALAPNCLGVFKSETIDFSQKWNLSLIGGYLKQKLKKKSLAMRVAAIENCSLIPMDRKKPWLKLFRAHEKWKDSWGYPIVCRKKEKYLIIQSYGKQGLEQDAIELGKIRVE